jgi:hypothetical protein
MDAMQASGQRTRSNRIVAQAKPAQLGDRDRTVLSCSQLGNR